MHPGIRIADAHNSFSFRKHERNPFPLRIHPHLLLYRARPFNPNQQAEELFAMPNEQIVPRRRHFRRPRRGALLARPPPPPPPPFRAKNKLRPPRRIICGLCRTVVTRNVQFTCRHQSYSTLFAPETGIPSSLISAALTISFYLAPLVYSPPPLLRIGPSPCFFLSVLSRFSIY